MESNPSALIQDESSPEGQPLTSNATSAAVRDQLIRALELDLVGPTPALLAELDAEGRGEEASELREELLDRPPNRWYQTGFLIPSETSLGDRADDRRGRIGAAGIAACLVVAAAAAIMASVFFGFVFGDDATIKLFGLSLATAVLLDAFVVRLVLVPSLMTLFGNANWWLPGWLDKLLPHLSVETDDQTYEAEAGLIEDIPAAR